MTSTSALECNEDLENVILVKMEDIQPDRSSDVYILGSESSYVNRVMDHDYSCVFNDEDSNIGSMVSIHSEEVEDLIKVDNSENNEVVKDEKSKTAEFYASNPDSWPTLEILPGGVIKHSENVITSLHQVESNEKEMMYACAKCPLTFKFLVNLVKHVKLHEDEQRKRRKEMKKQESKSSKSEKLTFVPIGAKKTRGKFKKHKTSKYECGHK